MTCIVAIRDKNYSIVASDSGAFTESSRLLTTTLKIGNFGKIIFGTAGSIRVINILKHYLNDPKLIKKTKTQDAETFIVKRFVPILKQALTEAGASYQNDGGHTFENEIILIVDTKIFVIQNDYSVLEPKEDFFASGSASYAASGALYVLNNLDPTHQIYTIEQKALMALSAAVGLHNTAAAPFFMISTKDPETILSLGASSA